MADPGRKGPGWGGQGPPEGAGGKRQSQLLGQATLSITAALAPSSRVTETPRKHTGTDLSELFLLRPNR